MARTTRLDIGFNDLRRRLESLYRPVARLGLDLDRQVLPSNLRPPRHIASEIFRVLVAGRFLLCFDGLRENDVPDGEWISPSVLFSELSLGFDDAIRVESPAA